MTWHSIQRLIRLARHYNFPLVRLFTCQHLATCTWKGLCISAQFSPHYTYLPISLPLQGPRPGYVLPSRPPLALNKPATRPPARHSPSLPPPSECPPLSPSVQAARTSIPLRQHDALQSVRRRSRSSALRSRRLQERSHYHRNEHCTQRDGRSASGLPFPHGDGARTSKSSPELPSPCVHCHWHHDGRPAVPAGHRRILRPSFDLT